jgi:hypothetical protein
MTHDNHNNDAPLPDALRWELRACAATSRPPPTCGRRSRSASPRTPQTPPPAGRAAPGAARPLAAAASLALAS